MAALYFDKYGGTQGIDLSELGGYGKKVTCFVVAGDWLTSYISNTRVTVTVLPNSGETRNASIVMRVEGDTIEYETISVVQMTSMNCEYSITSAYTVTPTTFPCDAKAGYYNIHITCEETTTHPNCVTVKSITNFTKTVAIMGKNFGYDLILGEYYGFVVKQLGNCESHYELHVEVDKSVLEGSTQGQFAIKYWAEDADGNETNVGVELYEAVIDEPEQEINYEYSWSGITGNKSYKVYNVIDNNTNEIKVARFYASCGLKDSYVVEVIQLGKDMRIISDNEIKDKHMLQIDKEEREYTINLNEFPYEQHVLHIDSVDDNGTFLPWGVEFVTNSKIYTTIKSRNELLVLANLESIHKEEYFVIKNYRGERIKVFMTPNTEAIRPKEYKFKITKKIIDGRNLKIKILSKETTYEIPWECIYDGKPLSYEITPSASEKSEYVEIKPHGELYGEIEIPIVFKQEKSGKEINLLLKQTNDSVEVIKAD
jgi:hypothetical protein